MNHVYKFDLPDGLDLGKEVAIDTEALGLKNSRDRLCLVQLTSGTGADVHLVSFPEADYSNSPNLVKLLSDPTVNKIFHYARFDMAILDLSFDIVMENVFCTKIASRIARTYTDRHGLKDLVSELLGIEISKRQQSSYWGGILSKEQIKYAGNDVVFLHQLKHILIEMLQRENRLELVEKCHAFLPVRVELDLAGWEDEDVFAHSIAPKK